MASIKFDEFHNIIGGQFRDGAEKHYGVNPSTGEKLWPVPIANQKDVDDAVQHAKKAGESWAKEPLEKRKELLMKYKEVLMANSEAMSKLLSEETGKPKQIADSEAKGIAYWFDWHNHLTFPEERYEDQERITTTRYTPLGVVGAICPWNFPILLSIGKIVPAVMTGCTIILKPSPFTPYTGLKLVELAQQVFPPGVVQVVGGDDKLGPMLTAHPDIAKISFTGSIATGKKIMAACASTLKRVTLELGGNDATIVLPDVDIKTTAPELVLGSFQNSGQVCVATKRIYIHQDIYDEMLKEMVAFTKTLTVGAPSTGSALGPVQNGMQYEKVKEFFSDSKSKGYKFAVGDEVPKEGAGFFINPTIIDNPPNDSRIIQEEPFGPIVPAQPWSDEEEVIRRANNSNAGLAACVWGKDVAHAERIGKQLEAGSVFINSFEKPGPHATFSGHKESGIGGEWGKFGILAYCNAQVMHTFKSS